MPLSAFANAESCWWSTDIYRNTPVEHEKDHLHLPRILDTFGASWGHFYHTSAKEVKGECLSKFELSAGDVTHFDGVEGICNI